MQMELDELIYSALTADETLKNLTGWKPATDTSPEVSPRIYSTCIEVPPTEDDNTPRPYIIIMEEHSQNVDGTKDTMWESDTDVVSVGVEISANSPREVKRIRKLVRAAITSYIENMTGQIPYLQKSYRDGIAWDWTTPCYYDTLHFQCDMEIDLNEYNDE